MKKFISLFLAMITVITSFNTYANSTTPSSPKKTIGLNDRLIVSVEQTIETGSMGIRRVPIKIDKSKLDNNGFSVSNLSAQVFIQNPDKAYIEGDGYVTNSENPNSSSTSNRIFDFKNGDYENGNFFIKTESDFQGGSIPVTISLDYDVVDKNDSNNKERTSQQETVYVKINAPQKATNPAIEIKKVDALWIDEQEAGRAFQVPFQITNTGDAVANNIKLSIDGLESQKITLANGLSTADITKLIPGDTTFVTFNLKSDKKTQAGTYMLNLKYTFSGYSQGEKQVGKDQAPKTGNYQFSFNITKSQEEPSDLEFKNIKFPTGILHRNQKTTISFDLVNTGKLVAKNLRVTANSQDQNGLASRTVSTIALKELAPGAKKNFSYDFLVTPAADTKNYPVELKVEYTDDTKAEVQSATQMVGVFVKAPKEKTDGKPVNEPTPKLIIEDYYLEPQTIEAGKPFKLYLKFFNTNANKAVKNIKIFLTSDVQETVSKTDSSNPSAQQTGGGMPSASVFTPIDSSNTFYIANIAPGARVEKEISFTTVPDTAAKTYTVIANFEYEDAKVNKYTDTAQIGVPVVQQAKLEVGDVLSQGSFAVGNDTPITVDYYNTGKANLSNVMVRISGADLKFDTPSFYKGAFAPGSQDTFAVSINPESPGEKKAKIVWTFEDAMGNTKEVVKYYEFTVEAVPNTGEEDQNKEDDTKKSSSKLLPIIVGGVLLAAAAIGGGIYMHKKKKKEDEDLTI